jgi:phosphopantothenoylcysteine synthetase/decarboxylase
MTLKLCPTEDIVARLASSKREDQRVICFALEESNKLHSAAKNKLHRKNVDAIVANPLETMESKTITAQVFCKDGRHITAPEDLPKSHFAKWFIEHLSEILSTT